MTKADVLGKLISKGITQSIRKNQETKSTTMMIADAITDAMNEVETPVVAPVVTDNNPERVQYYLGRAAQEVANAVQDINFELGNTLTGESPVIKNITTDDLGMTKVTVLKTFKIEDIRDISKVKNNLANIRIGDAFSKYITLAVDDSSETIGIILTISLPQEYVISVGGDDFKKRATAVDKAVSKVLTAYLDN